MLLPLSLATCCLFLWVCHNCVSVKHFTVLMEDRRDVDYHLWDKQACPPLSADRCLPLLQQTRQDTTRGHSCVNTVTTWDISERTRETKNAGTLLDTWGEKGHSGRTERGGSKTNKGDLTDWRKKSRVGVRWPFLRCSSLNIGGNTLSSNFKQTTFYSLWPISAISAMVIWY